MIKFAVPAALGAIAFSALAMAHAGTQQVAMSAQKNLSRAQALQRADSLFQTFDLNHDGVITRDEAQQVGGQLLAERRASHIDVAPGLGGHTLKYLERTFKDAESVDRQQFEDAMLAHFDQMDLNHDGILTVAERELAGSQGPDAHEQGSAGALVR